MPKAIVRPPDLYDPSSRAYSHAVRAGNTVYVAGQMAVDTDGFKQFVVGRGDVAAQTRRVFTNMQKVVRAAGGELGDIVNMTVFLKDMSDLPRFLEVRREFFKKDFPASTAVQVAGLADKEGLVEVNAVAVIDH